MSKRENSFKKALLEAVDDGLLTLGESGRKAVYFHLQTSSNLKREEIADKPEAFVEGLWKIFGIGAEVIEKAIIKSLYHKLEIKYEEKENSSFTEYLNYAKRITKEEG